MYIFLYAQLHGKSVVNTSRESCEQGYTSLAFLKFELSHTSPSSSSLLSSCEQHSDHIFLEQSHEI